MSLLSVSNLYSLPSLGNFQLQNVSFLQNAFQNVAIIGETGSGKSTLLKIIAGFIQAQSGEIFLDNYQLLGPDFQLVAGHIGVAYLSQHFELRHNYKMKDLLQIDNQLSESESNEIYKICKVNHLLDRNSKQLSGGEKQRMALAKLLVAKPTLLILDEPYSNLDLIHKTLLKQVVAEVCAQFHITCILTSHDGADILPWADTILVMQAGKIIQQASPNIIYQHPINEYTASLLGNYIIVNENVANTFSISISDSFGIIRPEKFTIDNNAMQGILCTIKAVRFCGAMYELDVQINQLIITIYSNKKYNIHEEVKISIQL